MSRFGPHEQELKAGITSTFPTVDELSEFAYNQFDVNLETLSRGTLSDAVLELVLWACTERRERELLQALSLARPGVESFQLIISKCTTHLNHVAPQPWYSSPDPVDACILRGKRAMFNRDGLRRHVRELLAPDGANVLVVRGQRGSGCSHSLQLIVHLEAELKAFKLVYVDLETLGLDVAPDELVRHMAVLRGCALEQMPGRHGQSARWTLDLCGWFAREVDSQELQTWVVIDGLDHGLPRREILELVERLGFMAEESSQFLRVVVLGCSTPLSTVESVALHETITPVGDEALDEFFARYLRHSEQTADPEAVRNAVSAIRERAGEHSPDRLRRLSEQAVLVARRFQERGDLNDD
jgi:hypothetical protein